MAHPPVADSAADTPRLVLVGAGHAHLFVLEALARGRFPPARVTLVAPHPRHLYSGMVSGFIGGLYGIDDLSFDLPSLAAAADAAYIRGNALRLDTGTPQVELDNGRLVGYDIASFAIGSGVVGADLPGVREWAVTAKPIDAAESMLTTLERRAATGVPRVVVVGGGAGGVELALGIRARLRRMGLADAPVSLVDRQLRLVADRSEASARAASRALADNAIEVRLESDVGEVGSGVVRLKNGVEIQFDLLVWATGATASTLFRTAGLETDDRGFLLVDDTLRSVSDPAVFAAGDAATLRQFPGIPKSGVYAVRQGPVLSHNLMLALTHGPSRDYRHFRTQSRSLVLVNTGDGRALLSYGAVAVRARWAMRLKDWIDRRFMDRFHRLA
jgi:selenide, water dikinase